MILIFKCQLLSEYNIVCSEADMISNHRHLSFLLVTEIVKKKKKKRKESMCQPWGEESQKAT